MIVLVMNSIIGLKEGEGSNCIIASIIFFSKNLCLNSSYASLILKLMLLKVVNLNILLCMEL